MAEDLKSLARHFTEEALNKGNLDLIDQMFLPSYKFHLPPAPDLVGLQAYKEYCESLRQAFPNLHVDIDECIAEANTTCSRWTLTGTLAGPSLLMSLVPPNAKVVMTGVSVHHWENGRVTEQWMYADNLGFWKQLGLVTTK